MPDKAIPSSQTLHDYRQPVDYAIVGGGCAGLYCAWRIARDNPNAKIVLFEEQDRFGGRLLSVQLPQIGYLRAELGGMRYIPRQQHLICRLISQLKRASLADRRFEFPTKFRFLRSKRFPVNKVPAGLYDVDPKLLSEPVNIVRKAIWLALCELTFANESAPELPRIRKIQQDLKGISEKSTEFVKNLEQTVRKKLFTNQEWRFVQRTAGLGNRPLYDIGFWNLLQHFLTSDEFLFVHDALGYESLVANWNAAQAIPIVLTDFEATAGMYRTLSSGMDALPNALADVLQQQDSVFLLRQTRALRVGWVDTPSGHIFKLTVSSKTAESAKASAYEYFARNVILALPQQAIRHLDLYGFGEDRICRFRKQCESVTAHAAFKMFLAFERPWWRSLTSTDPKDAESLDFNFPKGKATTDFPLRQIYYISERKESPAFIMASYSDDHYVDFWDPLVNDPRRDFHLHRVEKARIESKDLERLYPYLATSTLVVKAQRQLARIHGLLKGDRPDATQVPTPTVAVVKEWPQAWHFWNVHTEPWEETKAISQPFGSDVPLCVCGEAYSTEQGWVEGALKSAEIALGKLRIPRPTWLDESPLSGPAFDEYLCS